jgi:pantoate--beta-alanine ligase
MKLFQITQADAAIYGEKDFQQLRVLQQLVEDFNLPLSIISEKTVREEDGLALSSRNRYLSLEERVKAGFFPRILQETRDKIRHDKKKSLGEILAGARLELQKHFVIDYFEAASEVDLVPVVPEKTIQQVVKPRLFSAIKIGKTRLIDNLSLGE